MFTKSRVTLGCLLVLILTIIGLALFRAPKVGAFSLPEIVDNVKDFFTPEAPRQLTIDSSIELAPDGDLNGNNQIEAGEIVRFSFTINNSTDERYYFSTLKTNIDKNSLNFVHNVTGVTGLSDDEGTITLPNLRIDSGQQKIITFDARINYYQDEDKTISTEPELFGIDQKSILKSVKKEIKAQKIKPEQIPLQVQINKKDKP